MVVLENEAAEPESHGLVILLLIKHALTNKTAILIFPFYLCVRGDFFSSAFGRLVDGLCFVIEMMAKRSFLVGKMLMTDHNIIKKSHHDADRDKMLVRGKLQCSKSPPFVSSFLIRGNRDASFCSLLYSVAFITYSPPPKA